MSNDILKENLFLHRLSNLQALCSSTNLELPHALVFIPGLDGKQNKGSLMILKYLFQGAVGRDLYEASLDDSLECLDEIVLLIQQDSVSIFWSSDAKAAIGSLLNSFPYVLEYCTTRDEEDNVDLFEARKCEDFKRMILESVPEGGVVGLPVPLGYDDVLDTENWPMLQSFALDEVVCPTGFFTSRYAVIDITETLDIMFRTIDGYYVERAISVLQSNVANHLDQMFIPLRLTNGSEERRNVTAADLISSLQMLFEFGSLDTAFPVDPGLQPVVYLGAENTSHLLGGVIKNQKWLNIKVDSSLSAIIEACEPNTGMRWCRTYFLQRGKSLDKILDAEALISHEAKGDDLSHQTDSMSEHLSDPNKAHGGSVVSRLETIYHKLCTSFRYAVRIAFSQHNDVLEAGSAVQEMMNSLMNGGLDSSSSVKDVKLKSNERLQVHMDCMNAHGQLVEIEDVDEMGGQCWTYIRVSVHGISGVTGRDETYAVAVGDTFLFSSFYSSLINPDNNDKQNKIDFTLSAHIQDSFCLTHVIPRNYFVFGPDEEETNARQFLASTGSLHMISALGLGKQISTSGTGVVGVPLLTDHTSSPVMLAEMRLFTGGFVVEKLDKATLPFLVSFSVHVKEMWTVDMSDCYRRALSYNKLAEVSKASSSVDIPEGLLVVLQLKDFENDKANVDENNFISSSTKFCVEYNMLDRILPSVESKKPVRYVALCLSSDARYASALNEAHQAWRLAARMNDVPDHRGGGSSLPDEILGPFLSMIDAENTKKSIQNESLDVALIDNTFIPGTIQIPGSGYLTMRANFIMAENVRIAQSHAEAKSSDDEEESKSNERKTSESDSRTEKERDQLTKKNVILVIGAPGSGLLANASQLVNRLGESRGGRATGEDNTLRSISATLVVIDLTKEFPEKITRDGIEDILSQSDSRNVVVAVISSAARHVSLTSVIARIESSGCKISYCVSVIGVKSIQDYFQSHESVKGLGFETWVATGKELLFDGIADFVVFIEHSRTSSSTVNELFLSINRKATSSRVQPGQLWLDEDIIEAITSSIISPTKRNLFAKNRSLNSSTFVERVPQSIPSYRCLSSIRISLPTGYNRWDLLCLEKITKRILFPAAVVSITNPPESWAVPPAGGLTGMARCIELAKVKVFSNKQKEIGGELFSKYLSSIEDSPLIASIRSGVLSVHAILSSRDFADGNILFEANSGAVIIRKWPGIIQRASVNAICIHGIFSEKEIQTLEEAFSHCIPYSLPVKEAKYSSDLSEEEKKIIQKRFSEFPVPEGWWFDGSTFVDVHGKRSVERPDTVRLNNMYVEEQNIDIDKYNSLLKDIKAFI